MKKNRWMMKLKIILGKMGKNLSYVGIFERKIRNWGSKYNLKKLCHVGHTVSSLDELERATLQGTLTWYHTGGHTGNSRARDRTAHIRSCAHG